MAFGKKSEDSDKSDTYSGETRPTHPGKHGDHPLGGAVGAAVGGIAGAAAAGAASGAAAGTMAGPGGVIAGAGIGGVVGALAGKGIAQKINPTTEDAYWQENYQDRPYIEKGDSYDTYRPAYRYGVDAYTVHGGRNFNEIEPQLQRDWESRRGDSSLSWDRARPAARDAYDRLCACSIEVDESDKIE